MTAELFCKYAFYFAVVYLLYFQTDFLDKINKKLDFIVEKINKQEGFVEKNLKLECCGVKQKRKKHSKKNKKKRNKRKKQK